MWYNFSTAFFQPPLTVVVWLRDLTQKCVQPGQLLQLLAWWHWPAGCHFLAKRGPQIATAASQLWGRQEWGTAGSRVSWERSKETASELCVKSHQSLGFVTCHGSKASGKNCRLIFQGEWLIPLLFRFPDSCQYKNLGLMGFLLFTYCGWYFFTKTGTNTLMLNSQHVQCPKTWNRLEEREEVSPVPSIPLCWAMGLGEKSACAQATVRKAQTWGGAEGRACNKEAGQGH